MGMMLHPLANPRRVALEVMAEVLTPPPPVDLPDWAARNIEFGSDSPFPGPFSFDRFPFFRRILEVLSPDYPVSFVVLCKSAQIGGTVLAQAAAAGVLDLAPVHMLYVHPNAGNAKKWMRRKFRPMVKTTRLAGVMRPEGSRIGHSSMAWERTDEAGSLQLAAAESPNDLSMASYPYQIQDDISKWPEDNGAGDPLTQADSRTSAFTKFGGKIFRNSTPLVAPGCRITAAFKDGTRERYHVACPHCDGLQPLEWENMLASTTDDDDPHFTCIHCGCALEERHLPLMIDPRRGARWVAENPAAANYCVSFHIWAAYTSIKSWRDLWRAWLRAKGDPRAEQVFHNDWLGLAFTVFGSAPEWETLRDRAEETGLQRGIVPPRHPILTMGADCQEDRIEVQVTAWGPQGRRYVVDYVVIDSPITDEDGQRRLTEQLNRTYHDVWGNERTADMLAVDANAYTNDVHAWHRRLKSGRVILVRGRGGDAVPPLERVKWERSPSGKVVKTSRRWYNVGVAGLKASLYASLRKTDPLDMGFVGFARGLGDSFFEGLTSEVRKEVRRGGMVRWEWILPPGKRNEALDTANYCYAAAFKLGVFVKSDPAWEQLIAERDIEAPGGMRDLFAAAPPPSVPQPEAAKPEPPADKGDRASSLAARLARM